MQFRAVKEYQGKCLPVDIEDADADPNVTTFGYISFNKEVGWMITASEEGQK
jgi:hypothetical protein